MTVYCMYFEIIDFLHLRLTDTEYILRLLLPYTKFTSSDSRGFFCLLHVIDT